MNANPDPYQRKKLSCSPFSSSTLKKEGDGPFIFLCKFCTVPYSQTRQPLIVRNGWVKAKVRYRYFSAPKYKRHRLEFQISLTLFLQLLCFLRCIGTGTVEVFHTGFIFSVHGVSGQWSICGEHSPTQTGALLYPSQVMHSCRGAFTALKVRPIHNLSWGGVRKLCSPTLVQFYPLSHTGLTTKMPVLYMHCDGVTWILRAVR
jgi:hypothetical protein